MNRNAGKGLKFLFQVDEVRSWSDNWLGDDETGWLAIFLEVANIYVELTGKGSSSWSRKKLLLMRNSHSFFQNNGWTSP